MKASTTSRRQIQDLLKEHNGQWAVNGLVKVAATGTEAAPDSDVQSPETYIGYERADSFMSPGGPSKDVSHLYSVPAHLELNQWALSGKWTDGAQSRVSIP